MSKKDTQISASSPDYSHSGYCSVCKKVHRLQSITNLDACFALMDKLERQKHIYLFADATDAADYSTNYLFGSSRGKMFGVLEGLDRHGNPVHLYAFSGQYNGFWNIYGWAPPLFDEKNWHSINGKTEIRIKSMGKKLADMVHHSSVYLEMKRQRKELSQKLMQQLHALYRLSNFKREQCNLADFFPERRGIPTGTADCCAPKLLNQAQSLEITPIGIAEFYWGKENRSGTRKHGLFYPACNDKCRPILGFMLCGLEEKQQETVKGR